MPELWLERLAEEFWNAAGTAEPFPRALESSVIWALPAAIVKLPRLSVSTAQKWLAERNMPLHLDSSDRYLHACLMAYGGKGVILLDGRDPADELRFSVAHEAAHFIVDYLNPRKIAEERFGASILDVLDGRRLATRDERGAALLSKSSIGIYRHLMARSTEGEITSGRVERAERDADNLAFELLAPEEIVRNVLKKGGDVQHLTRLHIMYCLKKYFGLPQLAALRYSSRFSPAAQPKSVRQWLGIL
jgi:hypothetical protein